MRPPITITNKDKHGKVTNPTRWFVRVGAKSRTFSQAQWIQGGIAWINEQLGGTK